MNNFAQRLRKMREKRGLSQANLAKACGLSQSAIASYESGIRKNTSAWLELSQALNVDPVWLLTGKEISSPIKTSDKTKITSDANNLYKYSQTHAWPFKRLSPDEFWSLKEEHRNLIDSVVATMVNNLIENKKP